MTTTVLPRVRADTLPERTDFDSPGCEVNPVPLGCLTCPLPRCKYDELDHHAIANAARQHRAAERQRRLLDLIGQARRGITVPELAQALGVGARTIHRDLQAIGR